jgi:Flp pilus assembly protein TadB
MSAIPISSEILGAMITPAVLISACGVLVLSTSNRVGRTVDRVRSLAAEVERLQMHPESFSTASEKMSSRRRHVADQLAQLSKRAILLRSAMTALYSAIGLLVGTSILVGVVALLQWQYSSLPVVLGFAGACALLYSSLLLVREARLAVYSTLQEVSFAREAALEGAEQNNVKRLDPGRL